MKIILLAFLFLATAFHLAFSQVPEGINYQAIARDFEGKPLTDAAISIQFTILNGGSSGTAEYVETHLATTNQLGLFTLVIGDGLPVQGNFNSIDWAAGNKWLEVAMDASGGNDYQLLGTSQLLAVPYALYAAKSAPDQTINLIGTNPIQVSGTYPDFTLSAPGIETYSAGTGIDISSGVISNNAPDQPVTLTGSGAVTISGSYPNFTIDAATGSSIWQQDGDTATYTGPVKVSNGALLVEGDSGSVELSGEGNKLVYLPEKGALAVGYQGVDNDLPTLLAYEWDLDSIGKFSFSSGYMSRAIADYSIALGRNSTAYGLYSTAIGNRALASGTSSFALGRFTVASGFNSTAMGELTEARGQNATAMGTSTLATASSATAMGSNSIASSPCATAMGLRTFASGFAATATGHSTRAIGQYSTAMGLETIAEGDDSFASGYRTNATGAYSTAMGLGTEASGASSTAMGNNTNARGHYSVAIGTRSEAYGVGSFAAGSSSDANADYSIAMGISSISNGECSTAIGFETLASDSYALATGNRTLASGVASTAMGFNTEASGNYAVSLGSSTRAAGLNSTTMGNQTFANGNYSTAMGSNVTANNPGSFIIGDNSTITNLSTFWNNSMSMRFAGGYYFFSNATANAGVFLAPGGGSWSTLSDRNKKKNFRFEDAEEVLIKVKDLPVMSWNYKSQPEHIRHIGPTAQDFQQAFQLSPSDTTINTIDIDGINMLAIKGLIERNEKLQQKVEDLQRQLGNQQAIIYKQGEQLNTQRQEIQANKVQNHIQKEENLRQQQELKMLKQQMKKLEMYFTAEASK